jgi:hypothetical protein
MTFDLTDHFEEMDRTGESDAYNVEDCDECDCGDPECPCEDVDGETCDCGCHKAARRVESDEYDVPDREYDETPYDGQDDAWGYTGDGVFEDDVELVGLDEVEEDDDGE